MLLRPPVSLISHQGLSVPLCVSPIFCFVFLPIPLALHHLSRMSLEQPLPDPAPTLSPLTYSPLHSQRDGTQGRTRVVTLGGLRASQQLPLLLASSADSDLAHQLVICRPPLSPDTPFTCCMPAPVTSTGPTSSHYLPGELLLSWALSFSITSWGGLALPELGSVPLPPSVVATTALSCNPPFSSVAPLVSTGSGSGLLTTIFKLLGS